MDSIVRQMLAEAKKQSVPFVSATTNDSFPSVFPTNVCRFSKPSRPLPLKSVAGSSAWKPSYIHSTDFLALRDLKGLRLSQIYSKDFSCIQDVESYLVCRMSSNFLRACFQQQSCSKAVLTLNCASWLLMYFKASSQLIISSLNGSSQVQ